MRIHLYTICWNERLMLPYFLRYYEQFCEKIVVYDNGSDDGSQEMIAAHPRCELRQNGTVEFREDVVVPLKGRSWKESPDRPDWVIACDMDEFLYHPRLVWFLKECRDQGVTIPAPRGWQMVSGRYPTGSGQIYDEVHKGFIDDQYSKRVIFDPHAIEDMNYGPGGHSARPRGRVQERHHRALKLLHFKFLGLEYVAARHAALAARVGHFNRSRGYSFQYFWKPEALIANFSKFRQQARDVPLQEM